MLRGRKTKGSFKFAGSLLLMAAWLLCAVPALAEGEETASDFASTPCNGLKPFNNLDELLYQFYINLDSDCLFEMPVSKLEKIWDIKILSKERAQGYEYSELRMSAEFANKPYKSEKDAFYVKVVKGQNPEKPNSLQFWIVITKEYSKEHATLFPDGKFPKLLPKPIIRDNLIPLVMTPGKLPRRPRWCRQ